MNLVGNTVSIKIPLIFTTNEDDDCLKEAYKENKGRQSSSIINVVNGDTITNTSLDDSYTNITCKEL